MGFVWRKEFDGMDYYEDPNELLYQEIIDSMKEDDPVLMRIKHAVWLLHFVGFILFLVVR